MDGDKGITTEEQTEQNTEEQTEQQAEAQAEEQVGVIIDEDTEQVVEETAQNDPTDIEQKLPGILPGIAHEPMYTHTFEGKLERTGNLVECQKWDSDTDVTINLDTAFSITRHGGDQAKVGWGSTKFILTVSYDKFLEAWKEYLNERKK